MTIARGTARRLLPTSPFNVLTRVVPAEQFTVSDQVTHDKYGLGRVLRVEPDTALIIDFGSCRVRVLTPCGKLTKL